MCLKMGESSMRHFLCCETIKKYHKRYENKANQEIKRKKALNVCISNTTSHILFCV